jgi:hypothetical protein
MEVYLHPNFSPFVSAIVIAVAIIGDMIAAASLLLLKILQPYQTDEDFRKLVKLKYKDESKYNEVLKAIVKEHSSKGFFRRLFTRPRMKRLTLVL